MGWAGCTPQQKEEETQTEAPAQATAPALPKTPEQELSQDFDVTLPQGFNLARLTVPKGDTENPLKMIERLSMMHVKQDPWTKLDRQFREVLLVHEDEPYHFILQQQAANVMLRNHLFGHYYQDPDNPELLKAIGFYTMQLLEAKSEDAELVYKCLRALKDFWPSEQIAQAALVTAGRTQARPITSAADTTGRAKYRLTYAKALNKMAENLNQ
ncbi:hypothetical protein GCM10023183_22330 [Nibribacter koreensis]|uniref:Uncharacterized protein n=2 Tax=Nibribacter koreensis TaxID=1084519 RepID=A0ABP8FLY9_9BACT